MKRKILSGLALFMVLAMSMTACGGNENDGTDTEAGSQVESEAGSEEAGANTEADKDSSTEEEVTTNVGTVSWSGEITLKKTGVKVPTLSAYNDVAFKGATVVGDKNKDGYKKLTESMNALRTKMQNDGALAKDQQGFIITDNAIVFDWDTKAEGTAVELRVDAQKQEYYLVISGHFIDGLGDTTATGKDGGGYKADVMKFFLSLITANPEALDDTIHTNCYGPLDLSSWREVNDVKVMDNDELTDLENMIIVYTIAAK